MDSENEGMMPYTWLLVRNKFLRSTLLYHQTWDTIFTVISYIVISPNMGHNLHCNILYCYITKTWDTIFTVISYIVISPNMGDKKFTVISYIVISPNMGHKIHCNIIYCYITKHGTQHSL